MSKVQPTKEIKEDISMLIPGLSRQKIRSLLFVFLNTTVITGFI